MYIVSIIIGLIAGLIINYITDVLPKKRRLSIPFCPRCGENIPLKKYISFARCGFCGNKTSIRHLIVLITYPILFVAFRAYPDLRLNFATNIVLLIYLGIIFVIDIEHRLILNSTSIIGLVIALYTGYTLHGTKMTLLGGIVGYLIMFMLYLFGIFFIHLMNRKSIDNNNENIALGFGDVNLAGILGLILGWPGISLGLLIAIIMGGVISAGFLVWALLSKKYKPFQAIPYGPFLIIGALILLYA